MNKRKQARNKAVFMKPTSIRVDTRIHRGNKRRGAASIHSLYLSLSFVQTVFFDMCA
jgi:hypothetical protein